MAEKLHTIVFQQCPVFAGRMLSSEMYRNAGLAGLMRSSIAAPLVNPV